MSKPPPPPTAELPEVVTIGAATYERLLDYCEAHGTTIEEALERALENVKVRS